MGTQRRDGKIDPLWMPSIELFLKHTRCSKGFRSQDCRHPSTSTMESWASYPFTSTPGVNTASRTLRHGLFFIIWLIEVSDQSKRSNADRAKAGSFSPNRHTLMGEDSKGSPCLSRIISRRNDVHSFSKPRCSRILSSLRCPTLVSRVRALR